MELFKCFHLQRHSTCQVSRCLLYLKSHWDFLRYWLCKPGATWLTCLIFGHMPTWYVSVSSPVEWLRKAGLPNRVAELLAQTPHHMGFLLCFALVASEVPDYNYRVSVRLGCKLHMAAPEMIHPGHTWITCSSLLPHPQSDFWRERSRYAFYRGLQGRPVNKLPLLGIPQQRNWVLCLNYKSAN